MDPSSDKPLRQDDRAAVQSEDEGRRKFLRDLAESYKFNYTKFERDFIFSNRHRDVEHWPFTVGQITVIDKMFKKYLKRMQ